MGRLDSMGVQTCKSLLEEYVRRNDPAYDPVKLTFQGVGDNDVYNITAPFLDEGEWVIAGRVESRHDERSQTVFFARNEGGWTPRERAPRLPLQDPFFTRIGDELVVGGVETFPHPAKPDALSWRTVFYKGADIARLEPLFKGPDGMKDLRLVRLADGEIGVLTRPQGVKGGRGQIGFTRIKSIEELSVDLIESAPLLTDQFIEEEWGGANEAHLLSNGLIGVLGHIACFDAEGDRHYYPMCFALDPSDSSFSAMRLIAVRDRFLPGEAKRKDLRDVVFSGGIGRRGDGMADLYAGISDAEAHRLTIVDPFLRFEH